MLNKILSNDFNRNIIKLMTGATLAQAIPLAISPILTRLYTPEDFGVLALFIAITSIFGSIANARYELAIVLPQKDEEAINLAAISIIITLAVSGLLLILVIFFHEIIVRLLREPSISIWLFFAPLVVFFIGLFNTLNYLNTRMKNFGSIAKVKVIKSISMATVQLLLGLLKSGVLGLITGQIVSHIFSNGRLIKPVLKYKNLFLRINISDMLKVGKKYKKFPLITTWATLSNSLSQHLTSIFISFLYLTSTLGYYSLVQRILGMPTTLLGKSIGQVFFEKASKERIKYGNAKKIYKSTFKKLVFVSIPLFLILFLVVEDLVVLVFGNDWRIAGKYAQILIPLFYIRFLAAPLTLITIIFEKQWVDLTWQISMLISSLIIFVISFLGGLDIINYFILYSTILIIHYIIILIITYLIASKQVVND
ncbi:lipopolysaccharide biosynthesis protein [Oceanobacillus profundus]|uniref:Lipopolysaccharide biosynthesis protein n=1 Tax=Oceanobacillus profundus TaxID=372463 RepID=A0A417YCQ7_9BACI|nr:oligosaccharide flippase family protein [Oceanobacillus profundus]RHW30392.1 hypothetical protein D1B32_17635 [Oceanobacillus profundus]